MSLVGIGLRAPHHAEWLARRPPMGFVEVHSENFFAEGGATLALLDAVRASHPVSLHGVGLSLGSACGLDAQHLARLARLVARCEPVRVSDHACFARVARPGGAPVHTADLLPLAFNDTTLSLLCEHVEQVQDHLKRPLLVENISTCLPPQGDTMSEAAFLVALTRRTGCQLLLDLNNLRVNGLNRARFAHPEAGALPMSPAEAEAWALREALAWVHTLPPGCVGELHLAGCPAPDDPCQAVVDDHSQRVGESVWALYEATLRHLGPLPTLVEWDTALPPLDTLLAEADLADQRMAAVTSAVANSPQRPAA
ncbi:DUF692 domain-containing protein [Aquabacterium sp.]|uniref:DUF692 domain-containing protein n=1 Tax=Aquabacterium sp. TaxID=1872578 RepID=UPI0025BEEEE6|nr:DUF692 domain-containing protein [Aquabacterium sp.]